MKKIILSAILSLMLGQTLICSADLKHADIAPVRFVKLPVTVNGKEVAKEFYIDRGMVMLPLRPVAEALGYSVSWDERTGCATVSNDADHIKFYVSQGQYEKNENVSKMDNPLTLYDGKSFAPLPFFEEGMSLSVLYGDKGVNIIMRAPVR